MRIIVANKFWYRRAGLERAMLDEASWLEDMGHRVAHFSTTYPGNDPSPWSKYFAPYMELGVAGRLTATQKLRAARNMFFNPEAIAQFAKLVDDFRPDLVHIHGIHRQISPSILRVTRNRAIPVVQTLHDYHHVCPCDVLLRSGSTPCSPRECGRLWYGSAVRNRCVRGSAAVSALSAAETGFSRLLGSYERGVTRFISPSKFLSNVMAEAGWRIPIDIVPNVVPLEAQRDGAGNGFAVIGRLREEKGVEIALKASRQLGMRLTVAGDGPLGERLRAEFPEMSFTGHVGGDEVARILRSARAVVVPSLCFENASMTVLESMAAGVPVIGSRIGGIPEQISDGSDGLLVEPGNVAALADAMSLLDRQPQTAAEYGRAAREVVRTRFSPESHMASLLESYQSAIRLVSGAA